MALYGSVKGTILNTGRGGFHPGVGPQDEDRPVTTSTGSPIVTPYNGLELRINLAGDPWTFYSGLPSYLLGNDKFTSTAVNETDSGTFTITQPCRVWLLRSPTWNAVDITDWTLYSTGNSFGIDGALTSVYYRDYTAGTYAYDNNSAMWIWDFSESYSQPAGNIGRLYVAGAGTSTATTTSGILSAYRYTRDPFHNGTVTYSISSGSLPPGLSLESSTGLITGSYTASGINTDGQVYTFTVRATDATGLSYSDRTYTVNLSVPWLYRQIITTLYMAGGYKDGQVWSNINRFPRSTETCTNLGDSAGEQFNYKSGMCGDTHGYIFGYTATNMGGSSAVYKFNLRTEVKSGGPTGPYTFGNTHTTFAPDRNRGYITGEGVSNMSRFTVSTESYAALGGGQGGNAAGVSGENKGIYWGDANRRIAFDTETQATITMAGGAHGQQKGMPSKVGKGYGGNEGTYLGGYNWRVINIAAESYTTVTKYPANCGEENYGMTQDNGYLLGEYNGAQNNNCSRMVYATNAGAVLSTTVQGHGGASSGHCFWRD